MPASESNDSAPIARLSIDVRPEPYSYVIAPLATLNPPFTVVVEFVVLSPISPVLEIEKAERDVVAVPTVVVVAKYKLPPAFLNAHCAIPAPAESESCDADAEYGLRSQDDVVVPRARLPMKYELAVVVESSDPIVSCEVVATSPVPAEFAVMIPLLGNKTPRARVPEVVTGLPLTVNPAGTDKSTDVTVPLPPLLPPTHVPLIAKQPDVIFSPTLEVEVACPEILSPARVVVPKPLPDIENADVDVVADPATVVVDKYKFPPAFLNAHCAIPAPAESESCDADAEYGFKSHWEVVVPRATFPLKNELAVVVEISDPTVSCEVVATRAVPAEFDVIIEFAAKAVAFVPPFAIGNVPVTSEVRSTEVPKVVVSALPDRARPVPRRLLNEDPFTIKFVVLAVAKEE